MSWKLAAAPLMLLLCSAADAPKGWQQLGPGHYLCTEPAGDYDNYPIAPLQPGVPLKVLFRMVSENFDPRWTVEAAIFFDPPNGRSRVTIGKANNDRSHIYVALQPAHVPSEYWTILAMYRVTSNWIEVNLNMDAKGVVQVSSGRSFDKLSLRSTQPVPTTLHCNSGVFEVEVMPSA